MPLVPSLFVLWWGWLLLFVICIALWLIGLVQQHTYERASRAANRGERGEAAGAPGKAGS